MTGTRNKKIAIAALRGESYSSIGKRYRLTRERIRQIVHRECELADAKEYHAIVRSACTSNIGGLRKHRHHFMQKIVR